ncbi:MAG: rRNA (adenine2503-C2)-methyltransferase, partial [Bacillota bacterium]|nr:rRNA (adenine2503-C2)-methyltransferase [Bacillota bacterium]
MEKTALKGLSREEVAALLGSWGEPRYRAAQLYTWLYRRLARSYAEMT